MGAGGAVGGVPRESVHDIEFVVAGEARYGRGDGTKAHLAGSGGEGRHCCGWGAADRARWWWWWWGGVAVVCGSCGVVVGG